MRSKSRDETGRFMQAIAAFSATPEKVTAMGRELTPGQRFPMQAILSEINETVLRRRLVFRTEPEGELVIEVSERRLLLVEAAPAGLTAHFEGLAGRSLTPEDAPRVWALFDAFWPGNGRVWVTSHLPPHQAGDLGGMPVRHLFEVAEKSVLPECPSQVVSALQETEQRAMALVMTRDGDVVFEQGEVASITALKDELAATPHEDLTSPGVTLWLGGPNSEEARLRVVMLKDQIGVACDPAQAPRLFNLWRPLIGAITRQ